MKAKRLWATAMAGGAAATLLLAAGMTLTIRGLDAVAAAQTAHLRQKEHEITLVERLRWSGEVMVSAGRGYLLTEDPALLARLTAAATRFDQEGAQLTATAADPYATAVAQDTDRFVSVQQQLITARQRNEDRSVLLRRFEQQLLPLQQELETSLDRLVAYKEAALDEIYEAAAKERDRFTTRFYALLALLAIVGFVVTWFFARRIAVAYRAETNARNVARRAVASRNELMAMVAHDLRNPLGAIALKAAYLRERSGDADAVLKEAGSIESMTLHMSSLLDSMLDLATIEAGRFSVTQRACAVDELLREAADMFGNAARSKGVCFVAPEIMPDIRVHADKERVLQVLSNLLGNALRYTPRGGEIALSAARSGETARIAVSDSGPGIPAEHLPHLFDRFFRDQSAGKTSNGLGLFIARGIVEAHGGTIWAVNNPDRGATFCFTLPLGMAEANAETVVSDSPYTEPAASPLRAGSASHARA